MWSSCIPSSIPTVCMPNNCDSLSVPDRIAASPDFQQYLRTAIRIDRLDIDRKRQPKCRETYPHVATIRNWRQSVISRILSVGMEVVWECTRHCYHPAIPFLLRNSQRCGSLVCQFRTKRRNRTAPHRSTAFCGRGTILPSDTMSDNRFCDHVRLFRISRWFLCDRFRFLAADAECNSTECARQMRTMRIRSNGICVREMFTWWLLNDFSNFMYFKQYSHKYNVFTLPYSSGYGEKYHVSISKWPILRVSMYFTLVIASCSFSSAAVNNRRTF